MKKIILLTCLLLSFSFAFAQTKTDINGYEVELKKATEGALDLYWSVFQRKYYFFVETEDGTLHRLNENPEEQDFYKAKLSELTAGFGNTSELFFELKPLQQYINGYNASLDPNYKSYEIPPQIKWYATIFGGVTNNPFVSNPDNVINPQIGLEFEFAPNVPQHMHSGFLQVRHAFKSNEFEYQTTEFNIGYRFRYLRKERFNLFAQVKAVTFNINEVVLEDELTDTQIKVNSNSFDAPFIFGLGADFKIGKNSYITFIYSELFAIFFDYQGNFPVDLSLGYKLKL